MKVKIKHSIELWKQDDDLAKEILLQKAVSEIARMPLGEAFKLEFNRHDLVNFNNGNVGYSLVIQKASGNG